jgi:hypothetical protein
MRDETPPSAGFLVWRLGSDDTHGLAVELKFDLGVGKKARLCANFGWHLSFDVMRIRPAPYSYV